MKAITVLLVIALSTYCSEVNTYVFGQLHMPDLNLSGTPYEINYIGLQEKPNYPWLGQVNSTVNRVSTFIDVVGEFSSFPTPDQTYMTFQWRLIFNMKDLFYGPYSYRYFFIEGVGAAIKTTSGRTMLNCTVTFAETEPEMDMPVLKNWNGWVAYVDYPH